MSLEDTMTMSAQDDAHLNMQAAPKKRFLTMAEVDAQAIEADKSIEFILPSEFPVFMSRPGYQFIFYSATWCKYCKRHASDTLAYCTNEEQFCTTNSADGYPTMFLYKDGGFVEEYVGELLVRNMLQYLVDKIGDMQRAIHQQSEDSKPHNEL
ncbi:hypothetical protein BATDEDRAFT_22535 [Batrachochytrium dendrobatidis JAM81]|uniref:Thioredoxin domain-containing protein n=1 Tax=Batrachochytrium dendrobatidis (strain JAM81 / FGSC 10211) TaxID=684364 RepID=F4NV33_BATDJ|nr:uncharacterized protein BATDEDRAFT_22535 [Batrachochytrium dendrobatidis JAM81]EGF83656.1 hypothetical protein BATDEDRAFT_22535 [Batrachochytrium dendrobatidis JAM81]|eukprot:XP_006675590.1 hypothetical protein BATDEDRAFT_22535 [Batrachochytrium dendrobatidis JAM81]